MRRASTNRGVVYKGAATGSWVADCCCCTGPNQVAVEAIPYPKLEWPGTNKKIEHAVVLKVIVSNICGSDQHMVRGRTTAPSGLVLGHEITGIVEEVGNDVQFLKKGATRLRRRSRMRDASL